jgi:hypothetical protein
MTWLDYFIKYNDYGPNKPWHILLIDGITCYEAPDFIITSKINYIMTVLTVTGAGTC